MIWVLLYFVIGGLFSGISIHRPIKSTMDKTEFKLVKDWIPMIGVVIAVLFTPFWPVVLGMKVKKMFYKSNSD